MSKIEVNAVEPQCGTTLTLGASGDTVTIPSGATLSASKVSGVQAISWQTGSIKTSGFTAAAGEGYFCNTSSSAFTVTLPSGSAGAVVAVSDYTRTFQTNNLTISPQSGEKIGGIAADATLSTEGQTATFVYVDSTEGWINVQETSNSVTGRSFITATGGTITTCGNDKIHTFTGPGTFCVSAISTEAPENVVSYLVVAGGAGGSGNNFGDGSAGGGAGGFREYRAPHQSYSPVSPLNGNPGGTSVTITATAFPIVVGGGSSGGPSGGSSTNGSNSSFSTITSAGGGGAVSYTGTGLDGGSGGGSGGAGSPRPGGAGNTPPVSPSQGNPGGSTPGAPGPGRTGSGGGGATAAGGNASPGSCISGGAGASTAITGSNTTYSVGGDAKKEPVGCGTGPAEPANSGNGGNGDRTGGNGGSGIVVIRYKYQ